ncbi:MAG: hypothetical protein WBQ60_04190 [Asticcacaulis sp.]
MLSSATKTAANVTKSLAEHDVRSSARDAVHDLKDRGQEALDNVNSYANEAGQKVRGIYDRTVDGTQQATHKIEKEIKTNPVRSSAIALGVGFVLGAFLTRR